MRKLLFINLLIGLFAMGCESEPTQNEAASQSEGDMYPELKFDWQGHRGARGLVPENSFFSFLKALELGVNTLELDVVITADEQVLVSHDPWMAATICSMPDGSDIEDEKALNIYKMQYLDIRNYDCGKKGNSKFPEQKKMPAPKPLLKHIIELVDNVQKKENKPKVRFNIEIKSRPSWDNVYTPEPAKFVDLVLKEIVGKLDGRVTLQSFDNRVLEELNRRKGDFKISQLIENQDGLDANLGKLSFLPDIYSPYFLLVTKEVVETVHEKGMKIIPWTVNEEEAMQKLIDLGVDGIITDYPDKIKNFTIQY